MAFGSSLFHSLHVFSFTRSYSFHLNILSMLSMLLSSLVRITSTALSCFFCLFVYFGTECVWEGRGEGGERERERERERENESQAVSTVFPWSPMQGSKS